MDQLNLGTVVDQPLFDPLKTIPGVGKILGLTIFYEVGDIGRFQSLKHFCSYARVVPGIAQSGNMGTRVKGPNRVTPISNGPSARQQSRPTDISALLENPGKSI